MGKKINEPTPKPKVEEKKEVEEKLVDAEVYGVEMSLNIRRNPEVAANNQIAILGRGTKLIVVNPDKTIINKFGEWFKVRLDKAADPKDPEKNGYAMKKYIKVI